MVVCSKQSLAIDCSKNYTTASLIALFIEFLKYLFIILIGAKAQNYIKKVIVRLFLTQQNFYSSFE